MKRNILLKSITVSVALSAFLAGCGGSATTAGNDANNNNDNTLKTSTISGKAIDGYLQYATVCLDINQDGYCQATEPSTQTDENGTFSLTISTEAEQNPQFKTAMLLVYGGKDYDTGIDFEGKLLAPQDSTLVNITPLTTLLAKTVHKELKENPALTDEEIKQKIKLAKQKIATALDIPEEELTDDPVERFHNGDDKLIKKSLQLQKYVETFLASDDNETKKERAEKIYDALATGLDEMDDAQKGVDTLFEKTIEKAQNDKDIKALLGGERGLGLSDAARKVSDNIHKKFEQFDQNSRTQPDFLEKVAVTTEDDLHQVTKAVKQGTITQISDEININPEIFDPEFDWKAKFIKQDLIHIGIQNPSDTLIEKIKELFHGKEKIRPGILFVKKERLSHTQDPELQTIYTKINEYDQQKKGQSVPEPVKMLPEKHKSDDTMQDDNSFTNNQPQQNTTTMDTIKSPLDRSAAPDLSQNKESQKDNISSHSTHVDKMQSSDEVTYEPNLSNQKPTQQEDTKEPADNTSSQSTPTNSPISSVNTQDQSTKTANISSSDEEKSGNQDSSIQHNTTNQEDTGISQNTSSSNIQSVSNDDKNQPNHEATSEDSTYSGNQNFIKQEEMPKQDQTQESSSKTKGSSEKTTSPNFSQSKY